MLEKFLQELEQGKQRFRKLELDNVSLKGVDATDASWTECTFTDVDFSYAMLYGLKAVRCTFINCRFVNTRLSDAVFEQCTFFKQDTSCTFEHTDLRNARFVECDMRMATFANARLFKAEFEKTNATGASFLRAEFGNVVKIVESVFRLTDLRDADLKGCDLHKTSFEQADLRNARLNESNLTECSFAGANTAHTLITGADMRGANIAQLDVRSLDFTGVTMYVEQGRVLLESIGITLVDRDSGEQTF